MSDYKLRILGTRGIPASHGGFETFAQHLAEYLVKEGWSVTVYCQTEGSEPIVEKLWNGIHLIKISESRHDALGTMRFDWKCIQHAAKTKDLVLTLGYNTAIFDVLLRARGVPHVMNMDGIEWKRSKWGLLARLWFYFNEWAGSFLANHLIADNPEIQKRFAGRRKTRSMSMIPYGADRVTSADSSIINEFDLEPKSYVVCIGRSEPENSLLEIVSTFSKEARGCKLVVLAGLDPDNNAYHSKVVDTASDEVIFLGAIYDKEIVQALRFHSKLYIHGHTVGGTNPSLVESLGTGSPILAHDNPFNRWVAGDGAAFFDSTFDLETQLNKLLSDEKLLENMSISSIKRFNGAFTWGEVLDQYELLLHPILRKRVRSQSIMTNGQLGLLKRRRHVSYESSISATNTFTDRTSAIA